MCLQFLCNDQWSLVARLNSSSQSVDFARQRCIRWLLQNDFWQISFITCARYTTHRATKSTTRSWFDVLLYCCYIFWKWDLVQLFSFFLSLSFEDCTDEWPWNAPRDYRALTSGHGVPHYFLYTYIHTHTKIQTQRNVSICLI